jgi:hypothetical protein
MYMIPESNTGRIQAAPDRLRVRGKTNGFREWVRHEPQLVTMA